MCRYWIKRVVNNQAIFVQIKKEETLAASRLIAFFIAFTCYLASGFAMILEANDIKTE